MINLFKRNKDNAAASKKRTESSINEERRNLLSAKSDFFVREAYKALRTNVSFALTDEEKCNVIVVTSSMQGEGKSITAMNLAISYAMTDRKVLVIDCDLRRPKVSRLLQMNSKVGLSNLIMNSELKDEAILHTNIEGLDVILSGDIPPNPSELLGSPKMQQIINDLRESYDYIFLDSPPVNMVTDAVVLAPQSNGVLFLVRANYAERGGVVHAVEQLEYAKAKILGFVLNDVDMEKTHYAYGKYRYKGYMKYGKYRRYKRYGYGYGYGYGYRRRGYGYGYGRGHGSAHMPAMQNQQSAEAQKQQEADVQ